METVADAGIGDVSQVNVSKELLHDLNYGNRSCETDQAKVNFQNIFGTLPQNVFFSSDVFDDSELAKALGTDVKAPAVVAEHLKYEAAAAQLFQFRQKIVFSGFNPEFKGLLAGEQRFW